MLKLPMGRDNELKLVYLDLYKLVCLLSQVVTLRLLTHLMFKTTSLYLLWDNLTHCDRCSI